jgi:hypothetical protein
MVVKNTLNSMIEDNILNNPSIHERFLGNLQSVSYADHIQLIGEVEFIDRVSESLELIKTASNEIHEIVLDNLGQIRVCHEFECGVCVYALPPTFYLSRELAFISLTQCASSIAHVAFNCKLYNDISSKNQKEIVPEEIYSGKSAEIECIKFQTEVAILIKAPETEINWLKSNDGSNPCLAENIRKHIY